MSAADCTPSDERAAREAAAELLAFLETRGTGISHMDRAYFAIRTARESARSQGMVSGIEQCAKLCPVCKGTGKHSPGPAPGRVSCLSVQCRAIRTHLEQVRRAGT